MTPETILFLEIVRLVAVGSDMSLMTQVVAFDLFDEILWRIVCCFIKEALYSVNNTRKSCN